MGALSVVPLLLPSNDPMATRWRVSMRERRQLVALSKGSPSLSWGGWDSLRNSRPRDTGAKPVIKRRRRRREDGGGGGGGGS